MADEMYVEPAEGLAARIQVGGVWYVRAESSDGEFSIESEDVENVGCDCCGFYQGQVKCMVSQLASGWDFPIFHAGG